MVSLRSRLRIALICSLVAVDVVPCLASNRGDTEDLFTISVAAPTSANDVQVRYFFTGAFGGYGSYVANTVPGNKIVIKTGVKSQAAKSFKLIAYAPGCQFVTIAVDDLTTSDRQGDFQCQKLPTLQLHGRIETSNLGQRKFQVEMLYVCSWAMSFFGIEDGAVSPLFLGRATVTADGSFVIELPDFTADPSWPLVSKDAELAFFLKDSGADTRVAPLVSTASHSGNLPVAAGYADVVFEIPEM